MTVCGRSCDLFCSSVEQHSFDLLAPPPKRARERLVLCSHMNTCTQYSQKHVLTHVNTSCCHIHTHTYTVCSTPLTVYTSLKEKMVSESFTEVGGGEEGGRVGRKEGGGGKREEYYPPRLSHVNAVL